MRRAIAVAAVLAALAAAPAQAKPGAAAACPPTLANRLATTGSATQLVTVLAPRRTSTQARLELWRKMGDCWRRIRGPWTAWVGQRGVSPAKREGDRRTPAGAFGFGRVMYGVALNPGVRYRYHRIVCGDWWVEDPRSPSYNQFRHVPCGVQPPFRIVSEDMSRSPTAYRHLAVIDYNTSPVVPGRGSGIFLHASTGRPTIGCVSLPLEQLVAVLRWLRPSGKPLIVIGTPSDLRGL
jgi:L,D-peptidoglycan transpeptidase YkuD (ErfK/YbiS/YcfS/YnhG family)